MRRAIIAACVLAGFAATPADAATYNVVACTNGASGAFTPANTSPATITVSATCPATTGMPYDGLLVAATVGATTTASGAAAAWTITAPPGTLLKTVAVQRYFGKTSPSWVVAVRTAEGTVLDTCDFDPGVSLGCAGGQPPGGLNGAVYNVHTSAVSFGIRCAGTTGCANSVTTRRAWMAVYAATATVEDLDPPVLTPLTGTLTSAGWQRGVDSAAFGASDASGIARLDLVAGATTLASRPQACDFTHMRPCPGAAQAAIDVDTNTLADGTYALKAVATDAGGLQSATAPTTLKIDQHAPGAPQTPTASLSADGTYALTWTDPDQGTAAPIAAAHYVVCAADGTCGDVGTVTGTSIPSVPASAATVKVWLEDAAGNTDPASAAVVATDPATAFAAPHAVSVQPPVLQPSGRLPAARLHVSKAKRAGATLTVSGTIATRATGAISARIARTAKGVRLAHASTKPRRGRWSLRLHLSASARKAHRLYLTLAFGGDRRYAKAALHRRVN